MLVMNNGIIQNVFGKPDVKNYYRAAPRGGAQWKSARDRWPSKRVRPGSRQAAKCRLPVLRVRWIFEWSGETSCVADCVD